MCETKSKLTKLDLRAIKGMRNRIVHDYQNLDSYIIFDAIQKDLPPLKETLYEVISSGLKNNIFDRECKLPHKKNPIPSTFFK
ncbi:HepT-like ribonuclease domain-containing protein [Fibrobacter succinogenes]|uniref:HepT-like ribonuclease domain-containing protein n=1 Tax=Fibrobacter succinogenes TaxID=833 RepID=UPI001569B472